MWPEARLPRDRNRFGPPNALSEPFALSEPSSPCTRQVGHASSGRARREAGAVQAASAVPLGIFEAARLSDDSNAPGVDAECGR
jgi:hypothetical protein